MHAPPEVLTSDLLNAWDAAQIIFDTSGSETKFCTLCAMASIVSKVRVVPVQDVLEDMLAGLIAEVGPSADGLETIRYFRDA